MNTRDFCLLKITIFLLLSFILRNIPYIICVSHKQGKIEMDIMHIRMCWSGLWLFWVFSVANLMFPQPTPKSRAVVNILLRYETQQIFLPSWRRIWCRGVNELSGFSGEKNSVNSIPSWGKCMWGQSIHQSKLTTRLKKEKNIVISGCLGTGVNSTGVISIMNAWDFLYKTRK